MRSAEVLASGPAGPAFDRNRKGGNKKKMKKILPDRRPELAHRPRTVDGKLFWVQPLGDASTPDRRLRPGPRRLALALVTPRIAVHPQPEAPSGSPSIL